MQTAAVCMQFNGGEPKRAPHWHKGLVQQNKNSLGQGVFVSESLKVAH